ncbi:hypothetical protein CDD81_7715 [Ophiocordyceps australis]|uniref:Pre-mRNA-splicing factor SPF27 n=1 Tax=Ophiocordyceps australis TaxID=1399860 RepID=A0A2C5Y3C6_9HYPO|nr:hypothetical protein CDD81_7715 [Ophiocordyceps australis]
MAIPPAYHESLPYIDPDPSPESLSAARALIATSPSSNPPPPLPSSPPISFSPALEEYFCHISANTSSAPLSLSRYEAQDLGSPTCTAVSIEAIRSGLENSCLSYTYLEARAENLALLENSGAQAWLCANYHAEHLLAQTEALLAQQRRAIDLLNARRLERQQSVADELRTLDDAWRKGVARVVETQLAVQNIRQQIRNELKPRAEAQHKAQTLHPDTHTQDAPA